jgi:A/G-specific adenine glycosylase
LLRWYTANHRPLPWRETRDPYCIWVSEVMLQQTRVAAVTMYYRRFVERFPTVKALAAARLSAVLTAWSGLGYYRRARNLHAAARQIVAGGEFPQSSAGLQQLPGIGRYTAAAIASIAFSEARAVVDGNVERVLARLAGHALTSAQAWEQAQTLLSPTRPGDFNQAMMELGATICLPSEPNCTTCPVARWCGARGRLPAPAATLRRRGRVRLALCVRDKQVLLVKRPATARLMPDMWELPAMAMAVTGGKKPLLRLRHSITVTDYEVLVFRATARKSHVGKWVRTDRVTALPLTGLTRKVLSRAGLM